MTETGSRWRSTPALARYIDERPRLRAVHPPNAKEQSMEQSLLFCVAAQTNRRAPDYVVPLRAFLNKLVKSQS